MTLEEKFSAAWKATKYISAENKDRAWYWYVKGSESKDSAPDEEE